jgi:hypothetical protein
VEEERYDGIPVPELRIDSLEWTRERTDYIRTRSKRKGQDREFDVEPEWATEAALDPSAVIRRDRASKSGLGIRVTGYALGAGRVLTVIVLPKDHPPTGDWWGVNSWAADDRDRREYEGAEREPGALQEAGQEPQEQNEDQEPGRGR